MRSKAFRFTTGLVQALALGASLPAWATWDANTAKMVVNTSNSTCLLGADWVGSFKVGLGRAGAGFREMSPLAAGIALHGTHVEKLISAGYYLPIEPSEKVIVILDTKAWEPGRKRKVDFVARFQASDQGLPFTLEAHRPEGSSDDSTRVVLGFDSKSALGEAIKILELDATELAAEGEGPGESAPAGQAPQAASEGKSKDAAA